MKWFISIERKGFSPAKAKFSEYEKAKREYDQYNLLEDIKSAEADGRIWLCREDGTVLRVNYFSLETKLPQESV